MKTWLKVTLGIIGFLIIVGILGDIFNPSETNYSNNESITGEIIDKQHNSDEAKQELKSAELTIDKIQIQVANLYPTRVTITNTGDISISPKFDIYVYDKNNNEICSGSPLFGEIDTIFSGEKETEEISILGCMFEEDGTYILKIDLLDEDYNKLDTSTKEFTVNYWGKFQPDEQFDVDVNEVCYCSSNLYNCADFSTHAEAQECYEYCGGLSNDVHDLDRDNDGLACESLV